MREKMLWASLLALGVMLVASRAQSPAPRPATGQVGRYQLYPFKDDSNSSIGPDEQPRKTTIYRLDTATGETSTRIHYVATNSDGTDETVDFWRKIDERPLAHSEGVLKGIVNVP